MPIVALVLEWALQIYFWMLLARFFVDLIRSVNPSFRPRGITLALLEIVMTLTDPPIKLARRFIKPIRVGSLALDFAWTAVLLVVTILQGLVHRLG
ncbi:MAG: YggT family protein [Micrococcales bacterium]